MRLKTLRVTNFRCIEDSGEIPIDQVTCLLGKNEAGKTALIEALSRLNPIDGESVFEETDYPRKNLSDYRSKTKAGESIRAIKTTWELEDDDVAAAEEQLGVGCLNSRSITITKDYGSTVNKWPSMPVNEAAIVSSLTDASPCSEEEKQQLRTCATVRQFIDKVESLSAEADHPAKGLVAELEKRFRQRSGVLGAIDALRLRVPKFLLFRNYYQLPGRMSIESLQSRQKADKLTVEDQIFLALLALASSDPESINKAGTTDKLVMELEAVGNSLTDQVFDYWSQNRHLEVDFRCDMGRPDDPAPFNSGWVFSTRIENKRHRVTVDFDRRSTGFIWFFSFLAWFSQVRETYGDDLVILLDEPGLTLHGKAQQDLLRYINEKLRPHHQVIYTTHSPFMLDMENPFSTRTVEDVTETIEERGTKKEVVRGTKVGRDLLRRDQDTLLPLEGICGFDIARTMFVGRHTLVVEGPTEFGYLNWFSRRLAEEHRESLDLRWAVCPAESASKISSFVTLFRGRGLQIAVLADYHDGQRRQIDELVTSGLLEEEQLFRVTDFVDQGDADIEDLLGRELFRHLVHEGLGIKATGGLPKTRKSDAPARLVKEAEELNRSLPVGTPEFSHRVPLDALLAAGRDDKLPGIEVAVTNFEKLFAKLNALLP